MLKYILKYSVICMILLFLSLSLTCKRSVSPTYTDVDALQDYIKSYPDIFSADVFDISSNDPNFYREITKRNQFIRITFYEPDTNYFFRRADVWWDDTLYGVFHTFISGNEYTKEFKAFSRVRAYFEQWGHSGDIYRGWLLMKVSNVHIYSLPVSVGFSQVRVNISGSDSSISAGGLYDLKNVLQFKNSSLIKFTIQAADSNDFYYLHINEGSGWRKIRFTPKGDNDFTAQWTTSTQDFNSYKHAYIDCLDSPTVEDSLFRYNSRTWGILYKIIPRK